MIKNVHSNTVDRLGEAIVAGALRRRLIDFPEPLLYEELGGSAARWVVRESVKWLVAECLIHDDPKVGMRVLPADRATEADIAEIEEAYAAMDGGDYVTNAPRFHQGLPRVHQPASPLKAS